MLETSLGEEFLMVAKYGMIPFDHYALEKWNYDLPREEDGAQWRRLVMEYLDLSHRNRLRYKNMKMTVLMGEKDEGIESRLTPANIERVLKPFQTIRERNLTQLGGPGPIWITACYEESLHQQYCDLERRSGVGGATIETELVLSDPDVYNINGDIHALAARIVERLPGLFDRSCAIRRGVGQDLVSIHRRTEALVYVADIECVVGGFVKVLLFDGHGQLLLASRVQPDEAEGMANLWEGEYARGSATDHERALDKFKDLPKDKPAKQGSDAEWETESEYGSAC